MSKVVEVLIVDDQVSIRQMLRQMIVQLGGKVVAEAADGIEAIEKYAITKPDMVLLDINMPRMNGIDALKAIRSADPNAMIVMLTSQNTLPVVRECVQSGAKNFLLKNNPPDVLMNELKKSWQDHILG